MQGMLAVALSRICVILNWGVVSSECPSMGTNAKGKATVVQKQAVLLVPLLVIDFLTQCCSMLVTEEF